MSRINVKSRIQEGSLMKIKVKGRVAGLETEMVPHIESGWSDDLETPVVQFWGADGVTSVTLAQANVARIVASLAPYDPQARDEYFQALRDNADKMFPVRDLREF